MTQRIPASKLADIARQLHARHTIRYKYGGPTPETGMDAGTFLHYCLKQLGITIAPMDTNAQYRQLKHAAIPLERALAEGKVLPGSILFHVSNNGREPARYKNDGTGNADYCAICVDSKTAVYPSEGRKALIDTPIYMASGRLNTVILHPALDYGIHVAPVPKPSDTAPSDKPKQMIVTNTKLLRLRHEPDKRPETIYKGIPEGTIVTVLEIVNGWAKVKVMLKGRPYAGYTDADYLRNL